MVQQRRDAVGFKRPLLLACAIAIASASASAGWEDGLLAYLPMDSSLEAIGPADARPAKLPSPQFGPGIVGQCLLPATQPLEIPAANDFPLPRGTLSLFLRPREPLTSTCNLVSLGEGNFTLAYDHARRTLFFMTGRTREVQGFAWDYSVADRNLVSAWQPGTWHHLALTWDAATGSKAIYIDGEVIASGKTQLIRSDEFIGTQPLKLAADRFALDELMLWERVLSASEIKQLAQSPETPAKALHDVHWPARRAESPFSLQLLRYPTDGLVRSVVAPGTTVEIPLVIQSAQPLPQDVTWQVTMEDFFGRQTPIQPQRNSEGQLVARPIPPAQGIYRVHAQVTARGVQCDRDIASFACLPEPSAPNPNSFFGQHVNTFVPGILEQAARCGINWNRDHNMLQFTWWPRVQPEPGDFTWPLDGQHGLMQKHRMQVLGQFLGVPYWAAAGQHLPKADPMAYPRGDWPDLAALEKYVQAVVSRYPDITWWEIWNEPEVSIFFGGTAEQFAELAQRCTQTAHKARPEAQAAGARIMVGGFTQSDWPWHEKAAAAGAMKDADAISFHAYFRADAQPETLYAQLRKQTDHFRSLATRYAGRSLPIWDTESGCDDTTFLRGYADPGLPPARKLPKPNWRESAIATVQHAVFLQHLQVERSFLYLWNPPGSSDYVSPCVLDLDRAPKPRLVAHLILQQVLRDATPVQLLRRNEGRLWMALYRTPDGALAVLFTGRGGKVSLDAPAGQFTVLDIMGNPRRLEGRLQVDEVPIYLRMAGSEEQLQSWLTRAPITVELEPAPLPADADVLPAPTMPPQ